MCWEGRNARRERRDVAGEARFGGRVGRIFPVPLTRQARVSSPHFSLCPGWPERTLWGGDGLGAPDTGHRIVPRRTKKAMGDAAGHVFLSDASQIPLGDGLEDATEMLLVSNDFVH
jgi:hypothetical protein